MIDIIEYNILKIRVFASTYYYYRVCNPSNSLDALSELNYLIYNRRK